MKQIKLRDKMKNKAKFDRFFIDYKGNISFRTRKQVVKTDRRVEGCTNFNKYFSIKYYYRDKTQMVRLESLGIVYEDPLSILLVRSLMGYAFNPLSDHSNSPSVHELTIQGKSLSWPYYIRELKISTEYESLFFDKWVSLLKNKDQTKMRSAYFSKWCSSNAVSKQFNDKFKLLFKSHISSLTNIDLVSEVLVVTNNKYYFIDFFIPSINLGIEIDGYHHYYNETYYDNDILRTLDITHLRSTKIFRLPNNNVKSITQDELYEILEVCYDRAGFLTVDSISKLTDPKFRGIAQEAHFILNGKSAAKYRDYFSKYVYANLIK